MGEMLAPFLTYVLVTTFTPGPNNITAAAAGATGGYRHALRYLLGIASGFLAVMLICAGLTSAMTSLLPRLEPALKILGASYMLWLAYEIVRSTWRSEGPVRRGVAFGRGVLLQLVNPKVIIYGLTVFSVFLLAIIDDVVWLLLASVFLASVAFLSISLWALFGSAIRELFRNTKARFIFNLAMGVLLAYSAVSVVGLQDLLTAGGS